MTDDESQMTDRRLPSPDIFRQSPTEPDLPDTKRDSIQEMTTATNSQFVICHWSSVI
jgi:hypothetical protein